MNPLDGQLYIAGFQVLGWGTTATRLAGLGRVRYTGAPFYARARSRTDGQGRAAALRRAARSRGRPPIPTTTRSRAGTTSGPISYGSPQFKADGTPGIDRLAPSSAYLSQDGRSVFVGLPELPRHEAADADARRLVARHRRQTALQDNAYFTPYELTPFDPKKEGFGEIDDRSHAEDAAAGHVDADHRGQRAARSISASAASPATRSEAAAVSKLGPNFKGLFGSSRTFSGGVVRVTADEGYIRESILEPGAKVVAGFERTGMGMPSFAGVLTDAQIESIILFIKSLN